MPLSILANYGVLHFWQLFFRDNNSNTRNTCNHHKTISAFNLYPGSGVFFGHKRAEKYPTYGV
jgi:hypothetical protein